MEQEKKLGMKWHKFSIWFRYPVGVISIMASLGQATESARGILPLLMMAFNFVYLIYTIICWVCLIEMSELGYKLVLSSFVCDVVLALLAVLYTDSPQSLSQFLAIVIIDALQWVYYRKRKHLFFEDDEDENGAETVVFSVPSVAAPVVTAASIAPAAPVAEKPILAERAAPVTASAASAPAPVPVPAPAPAAETAALAPQADAEAAIEEEAVVPMPAKTESGAEPFKTDFVSPAKPAPCISFCRHCGKKLEEGSVFCNRCGKKVMWDE